MSSTSAPTISRFPVPELADAPEDLRTFIQDVADKTGFVPNILGSPGRWVVTAGRE